MFHIVAVADENHMKYTAVLITSIIKHTNVSNRHAIHANTLHATMQDNKQHNINHTNFISHSYNNQATEKNNMIDSQMFAPPPQYSFRIS